jgi:polyisoprenoid-binding protein YceI
MRSLIKLSVLSTLLVSGLAAAQGGAERSYAVDPAASDIHWLIYKGGTLQRLGHNHVISVARPDGKVMVNTADVAQSRFELTIPVADLVVDNPQLRGGLGDDFASVPTADDIAGTRKNMLTDKVLDGEKYPTVRVTGTGPLGASGSQTLRITVELLGRSVQLTVPTTVTVDERGVDARGEFDLNHADLGMKPFSVMLGALQVAEKMHFVYHVSARPTPAGR